VEVSGQVHAPAALATAEKTPGTPMDRRLGGFQSWSGCNNKEINLTCSCWHLSHVCPAHNLVIILTAGERKFHN